MKHILVLLTVVALMMVMLAMSVAPAFAARSAKAACLTGNEPIPRTGGDLARFCTGHL